MLSLTHFSAMRFEVAELPTLYSCGSKSSPSLRPSEFLEVVLARRVQFLPDLVFLGNQLVFLGAVGQWNDPVELGRTLIEISCSQRGKAVADRALRIDLVCALGEKVLDGLDCLLIKIRSDLLDC